MGRYPKTARASSVKCIPCNAPSTDVNGDYVCVECGRTVVQGVTLRQVRS